MNTKSSNFVKKWTKFQTKAQKCSKFHFIRKIWCSNRETGRFAEKLGDSRENRESGQVWTSLLISRREGGNNSFSLDILNRDKYLCWRILEPILPSRSLPEGKILPAQTLHDLCLGNEHNLLCVWGNENYIKLILHSMKSKQKVSSFIRITSLYLIKDSVKLNGRNL